MVGLYIGVVIWDNISGKGQGGGNISGQAKGGNIS